MAHARAFVQGVTMSSTIGRTTLQWLSYPASHFCQLSSWETLADISPMRWHWSPSRHSTPSPLKNSPGTEEKFRYGAVSSGFLTNSQDSFLLTKDERAPSSCLGNSKCIARWQEEGGMWATLFLLSQMISVENNDLQSLRKTMGNTSICYV